eukprot:12847736-Alexandrium_andersonii.AAC.1
MDEPGHEAELAQGRPAALARDAARADELRDLPEDFLELLLRDGDADAFPEDLHLSRQPRRPRPRGGLAPGERVADERGPEEGYRALARPAPEAAAGDEERVVHVAGKPERAR